MLKNNCERTICIDRRQPDLILYVFIFKPRGHELAQEHCHCECTGLNCEKSVIDALIFFCLAEIILIFKMLYQAVGNLWLVDTV